MAMDIVGVCGFSGRSLHWLDDERFVYPSGTGVCVFDVNRGPMGVIWRSNDGIGCIATSPSSQCLAVAHDKNSANIEIISTLGWENVALIPNPSQGKIVDMCFSMDGTRLLLIGDFSDHVVFVWDLVAGKLLFNVRPAAVHKKCQMNPVDHDKFLLFGDNGITLGNIREYLDEHVVKFEPLKLPSEIVYTPDNQFSQSHVSSAVSFALWAPGQKIFSGTVDGIVYEIDVKNSSIKVITSAIVSHSGNSEEFEGYAKSAILTAQHLVVGTSEGVLFWYPLDLLKAHKSVKIPLFEERNSVTVIGSYISPTQLLRLKREDDLMKPVSTIVQDPSFLRALVGSSCGAIFKVQLAVNIAMRTETADEELGAGTHSAIFSANDSHQFDNAPRVAELFCEPIYDMHDGVCLCSTSFVVPIIHTDKELAHLIALGSHRGQVSFWRSSFTDDVSSSPRDTKLGATPRIPKLLTRFFTTDRSAVTYLELLTTGSTGGGRLLAIGTASGWLELWVVEAYTDDENDEDMEETPLVTSIRMISRRKLFNSAIAEIKASHYGSLMSVASAVDDFFYVFDTSNATLFQKIDSIMLNNFKVATTLWTPENLWVLCKEGSLLSYSFGDNGSTISDHSPVVWKDFANLPDIQTGKVIPGPNGCSVVFTMPKNNHSAILSKLPVGEDFLKVVDGTGPLAAISSIHAGPSMNEAAICAAISSDGTRYATGCADGSINIYTVKRSADGNNISLTNAIKHSPHGAAVLCVSFTVDSTQLISGSADSSIFLTNVGHETNPRDEVHKHISVEDVNKFKTVEDRIAYNFENNRVLLDYLKENEVSELSKKFSKRTESLQDELNGIRERVSTLLKKNEEADELEKMELFEFVVDVKGRDKILSQNEEHIKEIKDHYNNINATNELVAARIRQSCWDMMERHCRRLFPLNQSAYNINALVSIPQGTSFAASNFQYVASFPTKLLTDSEQSVLSRVKQMRAVEIRCQRVTSTERDGSFGSSTALHGGSWRSTWEPNTMRWNPITINWLLNDGERWPSEIVIDELLRREKARIEEDAAAASAGKDGKGGKDGVSAQDSMTIGSNNADEDYDLDGGDRTIDENSIFNMLLPPANVRSVIQKRNQIVLLKEFCRIIKLKFNDAFDKLCSEKDDALASIEARYVRIREIFAELSQEEDLQQFSLHDIEIKGTDIKLVPGDITVNVYESEAAKAKKIKEEEERKRREAENNKADVKGRALDDMMNGVLEIKKDMFAAASTIQKPSWYVDGLTVDKMTDSQRKEFEDYEAQINAAQEEQNKYRKLLEMEVKKLKGEILDICKNFDDKLLQLSKLRMLTQRELLAQEMYMANLSFSMVKREKLVSSLKKTEKDIDIARQRRADIMRLLENITIRADQLRSQLMIVQEEERSMDRTFKRDIQTLCNVDFDQDTLRVLQSLFRIRHYPRKTDEVDEDGQPIPAAGEKRLSRNDQSKNNTHSQSKKSLLASHQHGTSRQTGAVSHRQSKGGAGDHGMGMLQQAALALDKPEDTASKVPARHPFFKEVQKTEKKKQEAESHYPLLSPLYMDRDCPDGFNVDQFVWVKLQELRHSRIEREIEAKRIAHEIHLLKVKSDELSSDDSKIGAEIDTLKNQQSSYVSEIGILDSDLHVVVALRQGQDEVDRDAVATDYSQSKLIPTAVTSSYNACINELGKEKIGVLTKTKHFRRKMNLISWEAVHLGLEASHLEELYTDAQLLKVTRDLQRVIREGSDPEQIKARLDRIGSRKNYLNNEYEKKLNKSSQSNADLKRILRERIEENAKLEQQIETLSKDVVVRKDVRHARGIDEASHAKKMKRLISRRHLVDQVRMQAEQIDLLKEELDRLRQKTYPSFVRATRTRLAANPDELGKY